MSQRTQRDVEGYKTWKQDYIYETGASKLLLSRLIRKPELLQEEVWLHNSKSWSQLLVLTLSITLQV